MLDHVFTNFASHQRAKSPPPLRMSANCCVLWEPKPVRRLPVKKIRSFFQSRNSCFEYLVIHSDWLHLVINVFDIDEATPLF